MRFGPKDPFFMVTNPTSNSELADICFETSLENLALQMKGGLSMDADPTMFTDRGEAEIAAHCRLVAREVSRAIAGHSAEGLCLKDARRIEILDGEGKILFGASLG